jgi:exodeoxyribonuclease VII large subunit
MALAARAPRILTVAQLVARIRDLLEADVGAVWVAGEISNLKRAPSGHVYFTLKDGAAQISAVMFRSAAQGMVFRPEDGMEVVAAGRPSVYPERGALQLYVQTLEPRGAGALQLAFEQLKTRLQAEGLFDPARKRPLPPYPETIGIVTALTGAVIHDMRTVLRQRWPLARIIVRPVPVQGREAAPEIVAALADIAKVPGLDVVIVGRGGGSLEDLWAFNEEIVARAIAACPVPVVSAVGHEVDFTIADFVADVRAPTPTAAAHLVTPDRLDQAAAVSAQAQALRHALRQQVERARARIDNLTRGLGDPRRRLRDQSQRIDDLGERLRAGLRHRAAWERQALEGLAGRLRAGGPRPQVRRLEQRTSDARARLLVAIRHRVVRGRDGVGSLAGALNALSPLACLGRGYAIARRQDGSIARDAASLELGESLTLLLGRGRARVSIEGKEP